MGAYRRFTLVMVAVALGLIGHGGGGQAEGADLRPGAWTFGAGLGFLGGTPDGTAFALNLNADAGLIEHLSLGPLVQLGFTGDSAQVGISGQLKYWIDIPGTANRLKVTPQIGFGFVHNSFQDGDTSWLIPLGAGADYALNDLFHITGTLLINFTNLDTGRPGGGADVMPGFTVGVRF